jgi:Mg2+-importing ATPase
VVIYLALVEVVKRALLAPQDLLRTAAATRPARRLRRVHRRAARFTSRERPASGT